MAPKSNGNTSDVVSGQAQKLTPFQVMTRAMSRDASTETVDYTGDDLSAILEAENMDELWKSVDRVPYNFQHLAGCEIQILDFEVKFSRGNNDDIKSIFISPDGKQMYLLATVVRLSDTGKNKNLIRLPDVGEVFTANTSAKYITAQLWRMMILGKINRNTGAAVSCVVEETALDDTRSVYKLRELSSRPVTASAAE